MKSAVHPAHDAGGEPGRKHQRRVFTWQERMKVLVYMEEHYPTTRPTRGQQPGQTYKPLAGTKEPIESKIGWQLGQLGKGWEYAYGTAQN